MSMTLLIYIAVIVLLVICSGLFSAAEMSFSSASKVRLEHMAANDDAKKAGTGSTDRDSGRAQLALKILERFDDALSTILVGNNLVNIAASSIGSVAVILLFGEKYTWLSTLIITVAVIIFGETVPKIAAKNNATNGALSFARPLRFLMTLFKPVTVPVVALVGLICSRMKGEESGEEDDELAVQELHTIIETAEDEDVLDEDASRLVSAAIDFADISASEIMTARVDILAIDIDDDPGEISGIILDSPYSRIPVYEDSIDNVIGILSVNHYLKEAASTPVTDLRPLLLPPGYVYKTMKLPAILSMLRTSRQHLAVVMDEYGGTAGVLSLEDVLEQLVGDIWDDTDIVEHDIIERSDNSWVIDGDTPVSDLLELMGIDEDDFDYDSETAGGWCIEMLDAFPEKGTEFRFRDFSVRILNADERRVLQVLIKKEDPETEQ